MSKQKLNITSYKDAIANVLSWVEGEKNIIDYFYFEANNTYWRWHFWSRKWGWTAGMKKNIAIQKNLNQPKPCAHHDSPLDLENYDAITYLNREGKFDFIRIPETQIKWSNNSYNMSYWATYLQRLIKIIWRDK